MRKLDGNTIRVVSVDRADKPVVDNIGDIKTGRRQSVLQFPEVFFGLNAEGDMVENKGAADRTAVLFIRHRLNSRPLKEGNQVTVRNLKKEMPVSRLTETGDEAPE